MREIKFRAWDVFNKRWANDPSIVRLVHSQVEEYTYLTIGCVIPKNIPLDFFEKNEESIVIMQYTGLNDKNGKEIYEGDIILRNGKYKYHVEWNRGEFHAEPFHGGFGVILSGLATDEFEVIGNIYETPELLKLVDDDDDD